MSELYNKQIYELVCVIVNHGVASKILKFSKECGLTGGTIFYGRGTQHHNRLLELLDLSDIRKEIILMIGDQETAFNALEKINEKFKLHKPNHGIAFVLPLAQVIGMSSCCEDRIKRGEFKPMYNVIFTVVDKGRAEDVIEAAKLGGAIGGTIINARGSGVHETAKLFNMEISPEKELILIVSDSSITDEITKKIGETLEIDKPGNGIIFVQDIEKAYGLYQKDK